MGLRGKSNENGEFGKILFTHIGTAGAVLLDSWPATALLMTWSSLSRMVFSVEMIRRVAIVCLSFFQ